MSLRWSLQPSCAMWMALERILFSSPYLRRLGRMGQRHVFFGLGHSIVEPFHFYPGLGLGMRQFWSLPTNYQQSSAIWPMFRVERSVHLQPWGSLADQAFMVIGIALASALSDNHRPLTVPLGLWVRHWRGVMDGDYPASHPRSQPRSTSPGPASTRALAGCVKNWAITGLVGCMKYPHGMPHDLMIFPFFCHYTAGSAGSIPGIYQLLDCAIVPCNLQAPKIQQDSVDFDMRLILDNLDM